MEGGQHRRAPFAITPDGPTFFVCNYDDSTVAAWTRGAQPIFTYRTPDQIGMAVDARGERLRLQLRPPQVTVLEIVRGNNVSEVTLVETS